MKATLSFDLTEEKDDLLNAVHGTDWKMLVWNFDQWLGDRIKHGDLDLRQGPGLQAARDALRQTIQDDGLTLE